MADDGERIRIPMEAFDRAAYAPVRDDNADDDDADRTRPPAVDAQEEYQKFLRSVFSGTPVTRSDDAPAPDDMKDEEPVLDTLEKLEAAGKIAPIRRFEEDGTYEERRTAVSKEALAAPPQPVESGPEAFLPVGGEAVDLKTAEKLLGLANDEVEDGADRWEDNGGATALEEGYAQIASDRPAIRTVSAELFDALVEVFDSIEAIPVEGANLSLGDFNAIMDRQAAARERVRKLMRGD